LRRRWLYLALGCWSAVWFVILAHRGGIDWKFFTTGTSLLFGGHPAVIQGITGGPDAAGPAGLPGPPPPGGLHIFASYPALQMGPLAYLVTGVLRHLSPHNGVVAAELFLQACGLLIVYLVERIALIAKPSLEDDRWFPVTLLAGGGVFLVAWSELAAGFAHLDDGLALLLAVMGVFCLFCVFWGAETSPPDPPPSSGGRRSITRPEGPSGTFATGRSAKLASLAAGPPWAAWPRGSAKVASLAAGPPWAAPVLAGLCIGLAADAKPWALVFLPVLLLFGVGNRRAAVAWCAALATLAVGWLPFFVADPGTIHATRYLIRNETNSALRALGVSENYTPSWDRPAQVALGCVLGALAVWRRRWPAVLMLAGGARLLLDPAAHSYYTPDVMVGALLWDMVGSRRPMPVWSLASFAALNVAPLVISDGAVQGTLRLCLIAAFTIAALMPRIPLPTRRRWRWRWMRISGHIGH